jgi:DNA repair protein RadC
MKQAQEGHRQRLRERFLNEGLESFQEHEVLELMLFYCIQRKDTKEIARRLLNRFGSLPRVLEANPEDLRKVEGMGEVSATFLSMLLSVWRYYDVARTKNEKILKTLDACGDYLKERFKGMTKENVYLLCMDAKCKVLGCVWIGEGNVNSASIPVRRIVEIALSMNTSVAVLAHNHPSGVAIPSHEDVATTKRLAVALDSVDIVLADHVVVADNDFISMALSGLYRSAECTLQA